MADFMKKYIWPGPTGYVNPYRLARTLIREGFNIHELRDDTLSYAYTVRDWVEAFQANQKALSERFGMRRFAPFTSSCSAPATSSERTGPRPTTWWPARSRRRSVRAPSGTGNTLNELESRTALKRTPRAGAWETEAASGDRLESAPHLSAGSSVFSQGHTDAKY